MKISNKRAFFDYQLLDRLEAGINLTGAEVKAVREGKADLTGSFVKIRGTEAYLFNSKIFPYKFARPETFEENRTRKLLLHKREIITLKSKTEANTLTIVPVCLYTTKSYIKVELALGKPKKQYSKKDTIKRREADLDIERELKLHLKK